MISTESYIRDYLKNLEEHGFVSIVPVRTEHGGKDLPASHFRSLDELVEILS